MDDGRDAGDLAMPARTPVMTWLALLLGTAISSLWVTRRAAPNPRVPSRLPARRPRPRLRVDERPLPPARHEPNDVSERFVWGALALMLSSLIAVALLVYFIYPGTLQDHRLTLPLPVYPAPRLQTSPPADMAAFYRDEMQRLHGLYWVDRAHGIVHIPIEDAMQKLAHDGIPGWPTSPPPASGSP